MGREEMKDAKKPRDPARAKLARPLLGKRWSGPHRPVRFLTNVRIASSPSPCRSGRGTRGVKASPEDGPARESCRRGWRVLPLLAPAFPGRPPSPTGDGRGLLLLYPSRVGRGLESARQTTHALGQLNGPGMALAFGGPGP